MATGYADGPTAVPAHGLGLLGRQENGHGRQRPDHAALPGGPYVREPEDLLRAGQFNDYAHWLRTMGEPFMHYSGRCGSSGSSWSLAVVAHAVSAYQLSRRDIRARPAKYVHRKARDSYATRTMRWGGIILGLFIVWHILDLTTGTVHPASSRATRTRTSSTPSTTGTATSSTSSRCSPSACTSSTASGAPRRPSARAARRATACQDRGNVLALLLTLAFIAVPVAVMTGVVS